VPDAETLGGGSASPVGLQGHVIVVVAGRHAAVYSC